jgi:Putative alpha-1,2-mannosidase
VILAPDKTPERIYVKSVKLNGKTINDYKLTHRQIMAGGTLEFKMK